MINNDDKVSVLVNPQGLVEYLVNGVVRYTSETKPPKKLHAEFAFHDQKSVLHDCKWSSYFPKQISSKPDNFIYFSPIKNAISPKPGEIFRPPGGNGWNSYAYSLGAITKDKKIKYMGCSLYLIHRRCTK